MSRAADRANYEVPVRIQLLEQDADHAERRVDKLRNEMKDAITQLDETMERQGARTDERLGRITTILMGVLISVTTACILLVINVTLIGK